jgi:uncharacterized protein (UPF0261 family)
MSKTVVIVGALDTKGREFDFVRGLIASNGLDTLLVDFGVLGEPTIKPDILNAEVALAGGGDIESLRDKQDKAEAMRVMTDGLAVVVRRLFNEGRLHGVIGMGGSGGTAIAAAAMRQLPVGVPKLIVSTVGGGDVAPYVGARDITVMPSVVDVAGINRISRRVYANAARAIAGMVKGETPATAEDKPLVAASMFGNTTACVDRARARLESGGYEVLVFHATGTGGRTMQSLIDDGYIAGVLDLTTTELADEVCGGVFSAGLDRVRLAAKTAAPVVLAPGCVDMCNFGARSTVPARYQDRNLYEWNANVTLMRTNVEENERIGELIAETANNAAGPAAVLVPLRGVSTLDSPGNPFWQPEADAACFAAIKRKLKPGVSFIEVDANINDPEFADRASGLLLELLNKGQES